MLIYIISNLYSYGMAKAYKFSGSLYYYHSCSIPLYCTNLLYEANLKIFNRDLGAHGGFII